MPKSRGSYRRSIQMSNVVSEVQMWGRGYTVDNLAEFLEQIVEAIHSNDRQALEIAWKFLEEQQEDIFPCSYQQIVKVALKQIDAGQPERTSEASLKRKILNFLDNDRTPRSSFAISDLLSEDEGLVELMLLKLQDEGLVDFVHQGMHHRWLITEEGQVQLQKNRKQQTPDQTK